MNAVEIESAVSELALQPFDPAEFPFAFLQAFGNKATTIKRLRNGDTNRSDVPNGVLQRNNIHIATCEPGAVEATLRALSASPQTAKAKAGFVLATDGDTLEAEDLETGETLACTYADLPDHFGFFLSLAGISTIKQLRDSSFDIRATSRLNRLYVQLLQDNPSWGTAAKRHEMNHFMARLIFCFFAEDTDIFNSASLFTRTVEQMSERDASNTHEVIGEIFRAMNTKIAERTAAGVPRWAAVFPYVNGGLFSGSTEVPHLSRVARSYLLHIGNLDWTKINPDIFGSMIQAVADDEERAALGTHYTSVPNILKVLTESNLLRRSLQRALYKDEAGRRVTEPGAGPLFGDSWAEDAVESGTIYVLRSLSKVPFVAEHRDAIHKIGVTGGDVKKRIADAAHDATYLLADVEIVATYKLAGINRTKLEGLLHRIFAPAQLDLTIPDRFGHPVKPREWFLVPLSVIDEAIQHIRDGTITNLVYDPKAATLVDA